MGPLLGMSMFATEINCCCQLTESWQVYCKVTLLRSTCFPAVLGLDGVYMQLFDKYTCMTSLDSILFSYFVLL